MLPQENTSRGKRPRVYNDVKAGLRIKMYPPARCVVCLPACHLARVSDPASRRRRAGYASGVPYNNVVRAAIC